MRALSACSDALRVISSVRHFSEKALAGEVAALVHTHTGGAASTVTPDTAVTAAISNIVAAGAAAGADTTSRAAADSVSCLLLQAFRQCLRAIQTQQQQQMQQMQQTPLVSEEAPLALVKQQREEQAWWGGRAVQCYRGMGDCLAMLKEYDEVSDAIVMA